jgi:hypothetical protein
VLANNECHIFAADCENPVIRVSPCWDWDVDCDLGRILLRVGDVPAGASWFPLAGFDPPAGMRAWIPSHPQGRCMEWDEGSIVNAPAGCQFEHQISTQGGSSGAPVLEDGAPRVLGVHVAASLVGGVAQCPNKAVYQSRLQLFLNRPFTGICDPTPAKPSSWGRLKTLYR